MPIRERDHDETSPLIEAIRRAIPTSRHAEVLFDTAAGTLGDRGFVEDQGVRRLYFRDSDRQELLVPFPLMQLALGEHWPRPGTLEVTIRLADGLELKDLDLPPPTPEAPVTPRPRGRGLKSGELRIRCGAALSFRFTDGPQTESCDHGSERPGEEAAFLDALYDTVRAGQGIEALAERIASFEVARAGLGRVWTPPTCSISSEIAWRVGVVALRRALWGRKGTELPPWLAADGFVGSSSSVTPGDSAAGALEAWRRSITENPPRSEPLRQELDVVRVLEPWERSSTENLTYLSNEDPSRPAPPPPTAAEIPAALLCLEGVHPPIAPPSFERAGFTRWQVMLGSRGHVSYALMRDEASGWTFVGQDLLHLVDPESIHDQIDALEAAPGAIGGRGPALEIENPLTGEVIACHWRCRTCEWAKGRLRLCSAHDACGYDAGLLDGDVTRRQVTRLRYVD